MAPVMRLDLFLSELLSSVSETTSLSFSEFSSELFSAVTVPSQKDNYRFFSYKAQHFFKEILLDQPRSVPKSVLCLTAKYSHEMKCKNVLFSYFKLV